MRSVSTGKFRGRDKAFTLIEILVIFSVIGVLAALLFPVFARAREQARTTTCSSNLRQLHEAMALYAADYNGDLPPYNNRLGKAAIVGGKTLPWPDQSAELVGCLHPYTHSSDIWFCPSDSLARTSSSEGFFNHRFASFAYHAQMTPTSQQPIRLDPGVANADTSRMALLSETVWWCKSNELDTRDTAPYSHNGRRNAIYFDGHVKSFRWDEAGCLDAFFTP